MKKIILILLSALTVFAARAAAEEPSAKDSSEKELSAEETPEEAPIFPAIPPEISLSGGYRFAGHSGSARADEYEYLHDSVALGGELRLFSYPHRLHLDFDENNAKDYYGSANYSFKDIFSFSGQTRSLFHNIGTIPLIDLDPSTASPGVDVRNGNTDFGEKVNMSNIWLRLKSPGFPFHLYVNGSIFNREGTIEQRFIGGSAYFNNIIRTSEARDIDLTTRYLTTGLNSHLGPVEVDLSHEEKRFDSNKNSLLFDSFTTAGIQGSPDVLNAGVFPHNEIPQLKGSSNTLKIHTNYTGGIVASATFSTIDRKNEFSNAKADYFLGAGEVTWMPNTVVTAVLKYRHKELNEDTPSSVTFDTVCSPLNNPAGNYKCIIVPAISSITDTVSGTVRYRPASGITLRAEYTYDNIRRDNAGLWFLPDSTQKNTESLAADIRVVKDMNLRLKYTRTDITNPSVNTEPNHSDNGSLSAYWIPLPWLNTFLSYQIINEERNALIFTTETFTEVTGPGNRKARRDRLTGNVTFLMIKDVSVTMTYSYMHDRIKEILSYNDLSGNMLFDPDVPAGQSAYSYSVDVMYLPEANIILDAGVSHIITEGSFSPNSPNLTQPVSIASFSALKLHENTCSFSGEYRFKGGYAAGVRYKYTSLDNVNDNPFTDLNDGRAHIVMLTLSKKW